MGTSESSVRGVTTAASVDKPESRFRLVLAEPFDAEVVEKLRRVGNVSVLDACDEPALLGAVSGCDALLVRTGSVVTRAVIQAADRLKVIGRGGAGLDNIDLEAARERGVTVVYTPAASTDAVADLTVGFMVALLRGFRSADTAARGPGFQAFRAAACSREMSELTVGVVGMGRIGRAVARRCRNGFNLRVLYNDVVEPGWLDFAATAVSKDELYASSDLVTLHVPLDDTTRGMIDRSALSRFRRGAYLINTSRGAVVDSAALAAALSDGRLAGAGLDVFDPEPLPSDHPLLTAPNTLFTPHLGARTASSLSRMNGVVDDVLRVLRGQRPLYPAAEQAIG